MAKKLAGPVSRISQEKVRTYSTQITLLRRAWEVDEETDGSGIEDGDFRDHCPFSVFTAPLE